MQRELGLLLWVERSRGAGRVDGFGWEPDLSGCRCRTWLEGRVTLKGYTSFTVFYLVQPSKAGMCKAEGNHPQGTIKLGQGVCQVHVQCRLHFPTSCSWRFAGVAPPFVALLNPLLQTGLQGAPSAVGSQLQQSVPLRRSVLLAPVFARVLARSTFVRDKLRLPQSPTRLVAM